MSHGNFRHGHSGNNKDVRPSPEYHAWVNMRRRCDGRDASPDKLKNYHHRGVAVCIRWHSFELFLQDMGPRPSAAHSIDRIDVNGHYEPGNCRWATAAIQSRNRRGCLTVLEVDLIRYLHRRGETTSAIAHSFGVRVGRVWRVVNRVRWADAPTEQFYVRPRKEHRSHAAARMALERMIPIAEAARHHGVRANTVYQAWRKLYPNVPMKVVHRATSISRVAARYAYMADLDPRRAALDLGCVPNSVYFQWHKLYPGVPLNPAERSAQ